MSRASRNSRVVTAVPSVQVLVVALAIANGSSATAQTHAPRSGFSEWAVARDRDGSTLSRHVVNRTFEFAFRYIDTHPTDLLLFQQVSTTIRRSEEGDNGRVRIEAWASVRPDTGYRKRLWIAELDGDAARLLDDYYEVTQAGCCGVRAARTYLSLGTGRPVATFTNGPVGYEGADAGLASSQSPMSIVFLSNLGAASSKLLRADSTAFGELDFIEGDSVLSRVVLSANSSDAEPDDAAEFAVLAGKDSISEGSLSVPKTGRAVVRIYTPETGPITIPVRGKGFTLVDASIPAKVRARLAK